MNKKDIILLCKTGCTILRIFIITTVIAAAFEKATGYPAESLLHQQTKYELFQLEKEETRKSKFEICGNKRR